VHATGTSLRHDVLIYSGNQPVFSFEVKVPTNVRGSSPYDPEVVDNARGKAEAEGLAYFGTLNCASFVVWQTYIPGVPPLRRSLDRWRVIEPRHLARLESPEADEAFRTFVRRLLTQVAAIEAGAPPSGRAMQQPEEELVARIEGSLETIVGLAVSDVIERFSTDHAFRRDLKRWMIQDQGWQWDDAQRDGLLLRATQVACYLVMNQILFYSTMRARFTELEQLDVSAARSGRGVKQRLQPRFANAMAASRDYETIFDVGFITDVAYISDAAATAWAGLLRSIEGIDLGAVGLDVLGGIFERLLSPEERHRFGQHYTSPELVDLLVGSAITSRESVVLDPASGGGTFLVRAYERLRRLGESDHLVLLSQIYGNDLSRFAGHLSTVNLAVRQIAREQNYPRIGTHDFFRLDPGASLVSLPLGDGAPADVSLPSHVDAVVGNPPYVRRQGIDANQKRRAEAAVHRYAVEHGRPSFQLDGLSDLHVYFWPQAARFLRPGGYLALLTSSAWLQTRYGKKLKELLLNDFDVVFLAETNAEPWFSDARVNTVATVARKRQPGTEPPEAHEVRFCQFRRPLSELLGPAGATDRWRRVEALLAEVAREQLTDELRVRSVPQAQLGADEDWSVHLRAPDIYERFIDLPGVNRIASYTADDDDPYVLTVGPKLGSNFYVLSDVTTSTADDALAAYGLTRRQVSGANPRYRIVRGLAGWEGPIESRFIHRCARGPGDEPTRTLSRDAGDLVLFIPRGARLTGTRVRAYIAHGESHAEHRRVYNAGRNPWYSIEEKERGSIIALHSFQYAHKVWENSGGRKYTTSPNCYLTPRGAPPDAALALLNSTWGYLAAVCDAGAVGTEGLIRFGGRGQWIRLHTIDPRKATRDQVEELTELWRRIRDHHVLEFPPAGDEELSGDRRQLDELAIQVAGITDPVDASEWVDELYHWLRGFIAERADVEEMAVAGRQSRGGAARIRNIVDQACAAVETRPPWLDEVDELWSVRELPDDTPDTSGQVSLFGIDGHEEATDIRFGEEWVRFDTDEQADFVRALATARMIPRRIAIPPIPRAPAIKAQAVAFIEEKQRALREELNERIAEQDPAFPDAFVSCLARLAANVRTDLHAS